MDTASLLTPPHPTIPHHFNAALGLGLCRTVPCLAALFCALSRSALESRPQFSVWDGALFCHDHCDALA